MQQMEDCFLASFWCMSARSELKTTKLAFIACAWRNTMHLMCKNCGNVLKLNSSSFVISVVLFVYYHIYIVKIINFMHVLQ
jgi:hypothetical protein